MGEKESNNLIAELTGSPGGGNFPSSPGSGKVVPILLVVNTAAIVFLAGLLISILLLSEPAEEAASKADHHNLVATSAPSTQPEAPANVAESAASWERAESAFAKGNYKAALAEYDRLWDVARTIPTEAPVADFFLLRRWQCSLLTGKPLSQNILDQLTRSSVAPIRAMAHYEQALLQLRDSLFVQARQSLYGTLALLGSLKNPRDPEIACDFLVADCMTRNCASLSNKTILGLDKRSRGDDPFASLNRSSLRTLLTAPASRFAEAALEPAVRTATQAGSFKTYSITCFRTSLEELLARLSSCTGSVVRWSDVSPQTRNRPVTMSLQGASEQRLVEVACGAAGLIAKFTGKEIVIHDPYAIDSTQQTQELLGGEAMACWRRIFLKYPQHRRLSEGHYMLGYLLEFAGDYLGALGEYQFAATHFPQADWAPDALLQSAGVRMQLHDYTGAQKDLLRLFDGYPNYRHSDQAYMNLGLSAMQFGQWAEARQSFLKLYHLNLSSTSRVQSCLKIGQCLYQEGQYKDAIKWFTQFAQSPAQGKEDLYQAHYLLGLCHAALGETVSASNELYKSLAYESSERQRGDSLLELAAIRADAREYASAISYLSQAEAVPLSQDQKLRLLLQSVRTLRAMGLAGRAVTKIQQQIGSYGSSHMRGLILVELALCQTDESDLPAARTTLTEAISQLDAGEASQKATCHLAELCLKGGQYDQAILLIKEMLKTCRLPSIRQKAGELLANACIAKRDYAGATQALSMLAPPETDKHK